MKITPKGPGDTEISQSVKGDKKVAAHKDQDAAAQASGKADKVEISAEARKLQCIAELAAKGDRLRAEKVDALKAQIAAGDYEVSAEEVAKSIIRHDAAEHLNKK